MKLSIKKCLASSMALAMVASTMSSVCHATVFSDVATTDWYYPYVTAMAEQGFVTGSGGAYNPTGSLSVAEFSVMIANGFYGNTLAMEQSNQPEDTSWWYPYVRACFVREGLAGTVASSEGDWSSVASQSITRYDMAQMMYHLLMERGVSPLSQGEVTQVLEGLSDEIPDAYETAVATVYYYQFISGKDGSFAGGDALTRAEASVVLSALVNSDKIPVERKEDAVSPLPDSQGQLPEGQLPDSQGQMGQLPDSQGQMGQLPEGQLPDSQGQMGQLPEGQLPDSQGQMGQLPEGQLPDSQGQMGQLPEGQLPDSQGQMGQLPEGQMPDSQGQQGQGGGQGTSGGMGAMESTLTVAEALALADQMVSAVGYQAEVGGYPIVDTNQTTFYSNDAIISEPSMGDVFYGQDANFSGHQASYTDNGDGTITDNVTGLLWQQDPGAKMTWGEAVENLESFNEAALGGYSDWRIPTIKELYSLVDFSGNTGTSSSTSTPYMNTDYFVFTYGDAAGEARFIDSQMLSSTIYNSTTLGDMTTVFGYNFADGRIKGYEIDKDFYCYYVRGNTAYGMNLFVDNSDDTITDLATSLMWSQYDSGYYEAGPVFDGTLTWEEALLWVQEANEMELLGYTDWRLPNIKELQSLSDFSQSPLVTGSPSIDSLFYLTPIINYFGEEDYSFYWSGTTHDDLSASSTQYGAASYVIFGNSMGEMNGVQVDAHGSGAQRSDPKTGERADYPAPDPNAPQGDEQRVFNMVRLVRDA